MRRRILTRARRGAQILGIALAVPALALALLGATVAGPGLPPAPAAGAAMPGQPEARDAAQGVYNMTIAPRLSDLDPSFLMYSVTWDQAAPPALVAQGDRPPTPVH